MDNSTVQLVGSPCGQHGPYTFYKAFKYVKNGLKRTVRLSEFFFVKLWSDSDLVCIGELQLLWADKNSEQVLSSLRLYFLPENTPEGRMDHGEDEVLSISEKVVLRLEDLLTWITTDAEWTWGKLAKWDAEVKEPKYEKEEGLALPEGTDKLSDLDKEQITSECEKQRTDLIICKLQDSGCLKNQASLKIFKDEKFNYRGPSVIILSYPSYCRYRAMMKRLEGVEDEYLKHTIVKILGGFAAPGKNTRVLFCRDTFDYPELEGHELLCNHLAPKLKGRPRGRRKKRSLSPGSESNESESSVSNVFTTKNKIMTEGSPNGLRSEASPRRSTRSLVGNTESKEFVKKLNAFMKSKHTPLGRLPLLGYKELDLHSLFTKVGKLGGYAAVTSNRLWKSIYDDLSANYASTSAATIIRRHYERFLLPYEKYLKGEEYKPPVQSKRTKSNSGSCSDADSSESTSNSGNSTPIPQLITLIPMSPADLKESQPAEKSDKAENQNKPEVKTSSLRSVRVKPDRLKDKALTIEKANSETHLPVEVKTETSPRNDISTMSNGLTVEIIPQRVQTEPEHPPVEKLPRSPPHASQITSLKSTEANPEGKENIATCNTNIGAHYKNVEIDLTEVPYKPKTPEVVHLEQASISNVSNPLLHSVKKRKLDILKEGGLEVTPVQPTLDGKEKETRPTVIHNVVSTPTVNQLSITLAPDKQGTLVASNSIEVTPRTVTDIQTAPLMRSKSVSKPAQPAKNSFLYMNGQSPPKVVQSRSIYSYSEKVVYGNPKDYFMPPPRPPPQAPKFIETSVRQGGGDILDLTIKSPQKPVVEIMRIPNVSRPIREAPFRNAAALPVLDARVGSNLEITLVGPNASHMNQKPKYSINTTPMTHNSNSIPAHSYRHPQKRTFSGSFVPNHKKDENGRLPYSLPSVQQYHRERLQNNAEINSRTLPKDINTKPSQHKPYAPPVLPGYLTQLSLASKMVPPYPVPPIDPIYYSALQSLYPHSPMPSVPPLFSVPTPEQLQFYTDFMARNAQMRFPFPYPQDGTSSMTANTDTNFKKP